MSIIGNANNIHPVYTLQRIEWSGFYRLVDCYSHRLRFNYFSKLLTRFVFHWCVWVYFFPFFFSKYIYTRERDFHCTSSLMHKYPYPFFLLLFDVQPAWMLWKWEWHDRVCFAYLIYSRIKHLSYSFHGINKRRVYTL